tara:strand:+ start:101 stop:1147 length:1047 start_codon:yes stop_codon:yes gene_type:complete
MKIFVTGGCGFIGSNFIIQQITKENNTILNYDKLTYAGNINNLSSIEINQKYEFVKGDITDFKTLKNTIFDFEPDAIINFAAESHVDRSIESPMDFVDSNIVGTATLLNISTLFYNSKSLSDFRFYQISTDEVYGSLGKSGLFTENSLYKPNSPYSASKASSDHLTRAWSKTFGLPTLITNCSNNYGPYQFPEKLIPLIIANCIDKKPLPIYGDGSNIRDWLYVNDHCDAIYSVLKKSDPHKTYNIGGNTEKTNLEIVNEICKILDKIIPRKEDKSYKDLITFVKDRPAHDFRYAIDSAKIKNEIGWTPKETFQTGIKKTVNWYLDNQKWWREIQKNKYNQERLGKIN